MARDKEDSRKIWPKAIDGRPGATLVEQIQDELHGGPAQEEAENEMRGGQTFEEYHGGMPGDEIPRAIQERRQHENLIDNIFQNGADDEEDAIRVGPKDRGYADGGKVGGSFAEQIARDLGDKPAKLSPDQNPDDIGGRVGDRRRLSEQQHVDILRAQLDDPDRDSAADDELHREIDRTQRAINLRATRPPERTAARRAAPSSLVDSINSDLEAASAETKVAQPAAPQQEQAPAAADPMGGFGAGEQPQDAGASLSSTGSAILESSPLRPRDAADRAKQDARRADPYARANEASKRMVEMQQRHGTASELKTMADNDAARERWSTDFWNVMGVNAHGKGYTATLGPEIKGVLGGMLQASGDQLNARIDAEEGLDENLTGQVSDRRKRAIALSAMGKDWVESADEESKAAMKGLKPGIGAQAVGSAMQSIAMMGLPMLAGVVTGGAGTVLSGMGLMTFGQAYGQARQEKLEPDQAAAYAGLYTAVELGTEFAPVRALMAKTPGFFKWFWNFLAKEVPSEILATAGQSALDKISVRPEMTARDFGNDMLITILSTPLAAGAQAGAVRALAGAHQGLSDEEKQAVVDKFDAEATAIEQGMTKDAEQRAERAKGMTHQLEDQTPVAPKIEDGKPVKGVWQDADGNLHEAVRAEPNHVEPNAEWVQGGVPYKVEVTGKGDDEGTARLGDGQEVPINALKLGPEAKDRLGLGEPADTPSGANSAQKAPKKKPAVSVKSDEFKGQSGTEAAKPAAPNSTQIAPEKPAPARAEKTAEPKPAAAQQKGPAAPEGGEPPPRGPRPSEPAAAPVSAPAPAGPPPKLEGVRSLQRQNRLREGVASVAQMNQIANAPDYDRLSVSKAPETGAPMVSIAGDTDTIPRERIGRESVVTIGGEKVPVRYAVIEAGKLMASHRADGKQREEYFQEPKPGDIRALNNGRAAGLREAYMRDTAKGYRDALVADVDHGIARAEIEKMERPVLVRVYPDEFNTKIANIGEKSQGETLQQSPLEVALQDAAKLGSLEGFNPGEDGDVAAASNDDFVRRYLQSVVPENERGRLFDPLTKKPNKAAYDRIEAAIFQKAYGSKDLTGMFAEANEPEIRAVLNALAIAAPEMAKLDGVREELDVRPFVTEAAKLVLQAKRAGAKLATFLKQQDIEGRHPLVQQLAEFMAAHVRAPRKMGEGFKAAAGFVLFSIQDEATADIFGDKPKPTVSDALRAINNYMEKEYGPEAVAAITTEGAAHKAAQDRSEYAAGRSPPGGADGVRGGGSAAERAAGASEGAAPGAVRREARSEVDHRAASKAVKWERGFAGVGITAIINGRQASIFERSQEAEKSGPPFRVVVSGATEQLRSRGAASTLEEAKLIAYSGSFREVPVRKERGMMDSKRRQAAAAAAPLIEDQPRLKPEEEAEPKTNAKGRWTGTPIIGAATWRKERKGLYIAEVGGKDVAALTYEPDADRPYVLSIDGWQFADGSTEKGFRSRDKVESYANPIFQPDLEQGRQDYKVPRPLWARYESPDEWLDRLELEHGDKYLEAATAALEGVERAMGERPVPDQDTTDWAGKKLVHDLSHAYLTKYWSALISRRPKAEQSSAGYFAPHPYPANDDPNEPVRKVVRGIRNNDAAAIAKAAKEMSAGITERDVIVPLPGHIHGTDTGIYRLAEAIGKITGAPVIGMTLRTNPSRKSQYALKKAGKPPLSGKALNMEWLGNSIVEGSEALGGILPATKRAENVWLLDNVIGTGETMKRALELIPHAKPLVYARAAGALELAPAPAADKVVPKIGPEEQHAAVRDRNEAILTAPAGTATGTITNPAPTQQAGLFGADQLPADPLRRPAKKSDGNPGQGSLFQPGASYGTPLSEITVKVDVTIAETGKIEQIEMSADQAVKEIEEKLLLGRRLLQCLYS